MLEKLPVIPQETDDIKFAEQYVQALELLMKSIEHQKGMRLKKFRLIYKMSRHQLSVADKLKKAQGGETAELEGILDNLRRNFNHVMDDFFKLNPTLVEKTNKELDKKKKLLPDHGMDKPIKAEDYFKMQQDPRNPEKKNPDEKVSLVRIVNKTSIPVRIVGQTGDRREITENITLRKKWLSFLNYNERDSKRTGRSIFSGARAGRAIGGILTGGNLSNNIVNLPNLISAGIMSLFGGALQIAGKLLMGGLKLIFKGGIARLTLLAVPFLADLVKDGINGIVSYMFGEDSGITKAVKNILDSDIANSAINGGALGAAIGTFFGPMGTLIGFVVGALGGILWDWIKDDGPKKLWNGFEKWWDQLVKDFHEKLAKVMEYPKEWWNNFETWWNGIVKDSQEGLAKVMGYTKQWWNDFEAWWDKLVKDFHEGLDYLKNIPAKISAWFFDVGKKADALVDAWNGKTVTNEDIEKVDEQKLQKARAEKELDSINTALQDPTLTLGKKNALNAKKVLWESRRDSMDNRIKEIENFKPNQGLESPVSTGLQAPLTSMPTAYLYNDMIGQKRMEFMNSVAPSLVNAPTNVVTSTNVTQRTTNSMVMQLSPLSGDRIN